jgi:hypothetical protein
MTAEGYGLKGAAHAAWWGEPLTERHVQAVWYDRDLRPARLSTRDGAPFKVVDPGVWNLGGGPDFKDAVLEFVSGRRVRGDVEVHLMPSGWDAHGHGADPAYRNVIAHVTWGCGPEPASLPPGAVSVWLGRFVACDTRFAPEQIDITAYPFAKLPVADRPCRRILENDPDLARAVLSAAGERRLMVKARRLANVLASRPGERMQVFYEEILAALGYGGNSQVFRHLAAAVPYSLVASEPWNAASAMAAAGRFAEWRRAASRPRNSPGARLAAAAFLFSETRIAEFADAVVFAPRDLREMVSEMTRGGHLGRGRAAAVVANVVVPFAIAEGRLRDPPEWLPPEDVSSPMRLTAFRMLGRDHNPAAFYSNNGLRMQGLLQICRDFCLQVHPDCGECGLVESLSHGSAPVIRREGVADAC